MDIALFIPVIRQILQVAGGGWLHAAGIDDAGADAHIGIVINLIVFGWWLIDRGRINNKSRLLRYKVGETDHA
ncbi:hypothetical protein RI570_13295 [Brucella pseudogrignonensis]|uniref:hypothetical protein n=1 Tax=Brucella pseudogrignonensis TaxID=419475 RepID=UPI0028BBF15B|nr:hypothetical protein [Brucella pseudogrignonensis]MDT6941109.1 hypothetical protein [Brucella pseudogrignonensis]